MIYDVWLNLDPKEQQFIIAFIPLLFLIIDILIKNGFSISIETAGADLSLAAVCVDTSFIFVLLNIKGFNVSSLYFISALQIFHILLWVLALRLVSLNIRKPFLDFSIGSSYLIGVLTIYMSLSALHRCVIH